MERRLLNQLRPVLGKDNLLTGIATARPSCHASGWWLGTTPRVRLWLRIAVLLFLCSISFTLRGREKDGVQYGAGLIVNIPLPEAEVTQAVEDVAQNGIIRGTREYANDEYVKGATMATSCRVFPQWTEGGKVLYKVRAHALDPQNFKDSGDIGTLAVRYVVQAQGDKNTVLRIDALYAEDFRRATHQSNGSVEGAEYKDIHDHLEAVETVKQDTAEAEKERKEQLTRSQSQVASNEAAPATLHPVQATPTGTNAPDNLRQDASRPEAPSQVAVAEESSESLERRVQDLRRQVERLVKSPGAALKSAPFHTASTLRSLTPGAEVLIVISTPYWYGVETHDGQHGWISRDQLEQLP